MHYTDSLANESHVYEMFPSFCSRLYIPNDAEFYADEYAFILNWKEGYDGKYELRQLRHASCHDMRAIILSGFCNVLNTVHRYLV